MRFGAAIRIALRELQGGRESLPVFVLCLSLGVAALAGVGSVLSAIEEGISRAGRDALGGDVELRLVHRFLTDKEIGYIASLGDVSRIVEFRGMVAPEDAAATERTLVQVKAVDSAYPLYGDLILDPPIPAAAAIGPGAGGAYGFAAAPELAARFDLKIGDRVRIGGVALEYRAAIVAEPDQIAGGMRFGPRLILSDEAIQGSRLLAPGSLFYPHYRLRVPPDLSLESIRTDFNERFPEGGWRWRDRRAGAPGVERFVQRIGAFLSLVALAALALGGVGSGSAIRAFLQRKTATIAILRTLGGQRASIATVFLIQTLIVASLGVGIGLVLGGGLPALLGPVLAAALPVPAVFSVYPAPLIEAAAAGYLTALLFSLLPLADACEVPPAALFREASPLPRRRPRASWLAAIIAAAAGLSALAVAFSGDPLLAIWFVAGFAASLVLLAFAGYGAARMAAATAIRLRRTSGTLRRAVAQIGGAGGDARGIAVSLGVAISILVAIALTSHSLRSEISDLADADTPAFYVIDIPSGDVERFRSTAASVGASAITTAPMLRGFITGIKGVPATKAEIQPEAAWVLRGDRGLTYATEPPAGSTIIEGEWWPAEYAGPPLVSFAADEGRELGLTIGSTITVNVLGRPLTARIANLREFEWRGLGMNFLMVFDPVSLRAAPHAHISTVYLPAEHNAEFVRTLADCCPTATAISVRDALSHIRKTLGQIASAALWGSAVTLLTGISVLIGVAAASQRRQIYEAAIMKSLGATRREILAALALKWGLLGALAALASLAIGSVAAWAILRFVMEMELFFSTQVAVATVLGGVFASLAASIGFAGRAIRVKPAELLRSRG